MLDHQKSYQRFLTAMKLLHVPVHTPSFKTNTQAVLSSAAAVTTGKMFTLSRIISDIRRSSILIFNKWQV